MGDNATSQGCSCGSWRLHQPADPLDHQPVMQLFDAYLGAAWELSCAYAEYFKRTAQGPYVSASKKAVAAPPNK